MQTEKKRRLVTPHFLFHLHLLIVSYSVSEDLNEALKQLRSLLPEQLQEKRFTQVEVLHEAVQYFAKVQKLAVR